MMKLSENRKFQIGKSNIPFVVLGLGMLFIHLFLPVPTGDDIHFISVPDGIFDFAYYKSRYFNWSSRVLLDFLVITFLHLPSIVWRIINTFLFVLLGTSISKLFTRRKDLTLNWFIVILLFIYPFREISDAGWVTTTIIYLWPLSFSLFAMTIIQKILRKNEVLRYEYFLSTLLLIISTNFEIISIIFSIFFLFVIIHQIIKKKYDWYIFFCFGLCTLSTVFAFLSPGTIQRRNVEVRWFLDFNKISIIDKLEIGLSSTFYHIIYDYSLLFLILCILLFVSIRIKYMDFLIRLLSSIPLFLTLFWGTLFHFLSPLIPFITFLKPNITKYGLITLYNFSDIRSYLPLIFLYLAAYLVPLLLYLVFGHFWNSIIPVGVIILGFLSRIILSFSPTIWASGTRTFFFLSVSIIICSVVLLENLTKYVSGQLVENLVFGIGVLALLSYINLVISL